MKKVNVFLVVELLVIGLAGSAAAARSSDAESKSEPSQVELSVLGPTTGELDGSAEIRWI